MQIRSVLFAGQRNAARSLMAESCFNSAQIPGWRAFSGGWQPAQRADRLAVQALREGGYPSDGLAPKPADIFFQPGAPGIDVCVLLDREYPAGDSRIQWEYWQIANPHENSLAAYRLALEEIANRVSALILSGRLLPAVQLPLAS